MDEDTSAFILGLGLRIIALIKPLTFMSTCLMIGIWEGFALHQATHRPASIKAHAMQALRFVFDIFFFGNVHIFLVTFMFLLVTWTITNAIVSSRPHHGVLRRRIAKDEYRRAHRYGSIQPGLPFAIRERVVQFRSPQGSGPNTGGPRPVTQPTLADSGFSVPDIANNSSQTASTEVALVEKFPAARDDVPFQSHLAGESVHNEAADGDPIPSPALGAPTHNESANLSPSQTPPLTKNIINSLKVHDSQGTIVVLPRTTIPTPPLSPLDEIEILHVHIPSCEAGPEIAATSGPVLAMEEEVGEVVLAVYRAALVSSPHVQPMEVVRNSDAEKGAVIESEAIQVLDSDDFPTPAPLRANSRIWGETLQSPTNTFATLEDIESIVSTVSQRCLQNQAVNYRVQALAEVQKRDHLLQERLKALARMRIREAFLLALKARKSQESILTFHRKAERRYFLANNHRRGPSTLDLHGLRVPEAIHRTERAIHDIVLSGGGMELRVIVGRGIHSPGSKPVLKPAVRQALEKSGLRPSFDRNPGILKVTIPARLNAVASRDARDA